MPRATSKDAFIRKHLIAAEGASAGKAYTEALAAYKKSPKKSSGRKTSGRKSPKKSSGRKTSGRKMSGRKSPRKTSGRRKSPKKSSGKKRPLSPYNKFMREEIAVVKREYPHLDHREAFAKAASHWKSQK